MLQFRVESPARIESVCFQTACARRKLQVEDRDEPLSGSVLPCYRHLCPNCQYQSSCQRCGSAKLCEQGRKRNGSEMGIGGCCSIPRKGFPRMNRVGSSPLRGLGRPLGRISSSARTQRRPRATRTCPGLHAVARCAGSGDGRAGYSYRSATIGSTFIARRAGT